MSHAKLRDVAVLGTGIIPFGKHRAVSVPHLARPAVIDALKESGLVRSDIEAMYCGSALSGMMAGQRVARETGLTGIPIVNNENACSSGATAFREAFIAVGSGQIDYAMVVGVEKLTRLGGGTLPLDEEDIEVANGQVMPGLYAMRAQRYLHDHGHSARDLAMVAVKSRRHGALTPYAQFRAPTTVEEVLASRPIADPLTLMQCCPTGDGAAAVVIGPADGARSALHPAVKVRGSHLASGRYLSGFRDMTIPEITLRCAGELYEEIALDPRDIDVLECHDAFTIAELLYYEALGLCPQGEAPRLLHGGVTSLGGRNVVNPSGGMLSKGHPVGASGTAQIVEIVRQLQGRCDARQVRGARLGLTHVTGGGTAGFDHGACCIHVFEA
ncbi:thiolase family protein [Variovorax sp. UC122_21]|jgi:benzoylsuccinyl-CoA thiolase BbsB subunit|uniref:thiolase family protein n=1 Tax=Variovorax TaxID=34072 RepID=UPI0019323D58|nr:thiolase family protein [Variovorax paradoxus]